MLLIKGIKHEIYKKIMDNKLMVVYLKVNEYIK